MNMNRQTRQLIQAMSHAAGIARERIEAGIAVMEGKVVHSAVTHPILVNQATAARLLSVSRFTVRRMAAEGQLRSVCIRGAVRYSREEIERLARGAVVEAHHS